MQSIFEDKQKRIIKDQEEINFSSSSAYHLIILTARVKSEKQLERKVTDDEDLIIKIDNKTFPKLNSNRLKDSPAAFSGGKLHNLAKTVYFLTFLKGKEHLLILETDEPFNTATFESLKIYTLNLEKNLTLELKIQAEDGDRRPWLTFALDNLPLKSVTASITYSRRKRDSDDVKVIIDGKTQGNLLKTLKHFLWRFVGSLLPRIFPTKTKTETFTVNLPQGLHYIGFHADRMPILEKIAFDFGMTPPIPEETPSVDNPQWTGSFDDDTEDILLARLIFGEAENQPKEVKTGVGYTVINRVKKGNPHWGLNNREVILKENQYDALWNPDRRDAVRDPLRGADETTREAWNESYTVATGILNSSLKDSTDGATHFHSYPEDEHERFPSWATERNFKIKIGDILFYELEA